ncbi:MAG: pyruvate kinase [Oligoflexia bacterium]|nr:pyruvate kinase [Oligoflexia bacterium]
MPSSVRRKVKIVCTLGPSSSSAERIAQLIEAGMDVARLNFSHGTHDFHRGLIQNIREASRKAKKPVAIMQDLQGPKLRAGKLAKGGIDLKAGDVVVLYPEGTTPRTSTHGRIAIPISAEIALAVSSDAKVGARILFDDGKIQTRASQVSPPEMVVEVEVGGKLTDHKGMNLPGTPLSIPCLTDKDLEDLKFGLSMGVDAVALSFVRTVQDIEDLRRRIHKQTNERPLCVAKIEREEAVEYMDSIIEVCDGLLVARGDMAVEIGAERVPVVQKQLIHSCNELGVPVITATQMLESMINTPTPTRAEASDVANAVFDGTDAVMLSGETASGLYPIETVQTMARIVLEAERANQGGKFRAEHATHYADPFSVGRETKLMPGSVVDAIEHSAAQIARQVGAVAIACITHSGTAARTLAKHRPATPIVAIMDNEASVRKLAFVWGVQGELIQKIVGTDDLFAMVEKVLQTRGWAEVEDLVVVTAGIPTLRRGTTNMVKVHRIGVIAERALGR